MPSPRLLPCRLALWLLASMVLVGRVVGQVPDSTRSPGTTLIGRVTDTTGAALPNAEVIVTHGRDSAIVRSAVTDTSGHVILKNLPAGDSYIVRVRKIGYLPSQNTDVSFRGDTLGFEVTLRPFVQVLSELVATDSSLPQLVAMSDGLIIKPFFFLKCFAIGIQFPVISEILSLFGVRQKPGSVGDLGQETSPYDCSQQAEERKLAREQERAAAWRAMAAAREAQKTEREVAKAERRIEEAQRAGRAPKSKDVLRVLRSLPLCGPDVPAGTLCREVITMPSQQTLDSLFRTMAASNPIADSADRP